MASKLLDMERHSHWHEMPMVVCPHCNKEFQWDDYYDVETGSSTECPKCENEIHVVEAYQSLHVCLAKEKDVD